jgi:hypothetical protein
MEPSGELEGEEDGHVHVRAGTAALVVI